jgi:hypothetical protein
MSADDMTQTVDTLRTHLHATVEGVAGRPDRGEAARRGERLRRRHRVERAVAGLAVAACILGLALVARPDGRGRVSTVPADRPSPTWQAAPPRLLLDGWTVTTYDEERTRPGAAHLVALYEAPDGRRLSATIGDSAWDAGGPRPTSLDDPAALVVLDGRVVVTWRPVPDKTISITSRGLSRDEVASAARSVRMSDGGRSLVVGTVPAGLRAVDLPASSDRDLDLVDIVFTRGDRHLEATLYPGGETTLDDRGRDPGDMTVTVRGGPGWLRSYGAGRFRIDLADGWWMWELDGSPFSSREEFLGTVAALKVVDEQTWRAAVAPTVVTPDRWPAEVARLSADIPLPAGTTWDRLGTQRVSASRYSADVEVLRYAVCAWTSQWLAAADGVAREEAVQALSGAASWLASRESEPAGDYATTVTNFPGTLRTGDERSVRTAAVHGFGCDLPGDIGPP